MFVPGKSLQPRLIFQSKAGAYPSEAPFRCSTRVGSWPYPRTSLERPVMNNTLAYNINDIIILVAILCLALVSLERMPLAQNSRHQKKKKKKKKTRWRIRRTWNEPSLCFYLLLHFTSPIQNTNNKWIKDLTKHIFV